MNAKEKASEDERAKRNFPLNVAKFEMTVLHDDGMYRHLRFANPENNNCWFQIVHTPGQLTISGDMGCFTFSRKMDMFQFFNADAGREINPDYWIQKLFTYEPVGNRAFPYYRFIWACYAIQYAIREYRRLT